MVFVFLLLMISESARIHDSMDKGHLPYKVSDQSFKLRFFFEKELEPADTVSQSSNKFEALELEFSEIAPPGISPPLESVCGPISFPEVLDQPHLGVFIKKTQNQTFGEVCQYFGDRPVAAYILINQDEFLSQGLEITREFVNSLLQPTLQPIHRRLTYCDPNCSKCNNLCESCKQGFYLYSGMCYSCIEKFDHCMVCEEHMCFYCQEGYFLSEGQCKPCETKHEHCSTCDRDCTVCLSCQDGYYLDSYNRCEQCNNRWNHCKTCSTYSQYCHTCEDTYYLQSNVCWLCKYAIPHCEICTRFGIECLHCEEGWYLDSNICKPCAHKISHCLKCWETHCEECEIGFYLVDGHCKRCSEAVENCVLCDLYSPVCKQCDYEFKLVGSECQHCTSIIDHCIRCNHDATCCECAHGYYVSSNGICLPCNQFPHCQSCSDGGQCKLCEIGYYLDNGHCKDCNIVPNCLVCENDFTCTECAHTYLPVKGQCKLCSEHIQNCQECDSLGKCTECQPGYYVTFQGICDLCVNRLPNCLLCNGPYHCEDCAEGFFINSNSQCSACQFSTNKCIECEDDGTCKACEPGYYLSQGTCYPCTLNNCLTCSAVDTCTSCNDRYFLKGEICESCDSLANCVDCIDSSFCSECTEGYYSKDGVCVACKEDMNCLDCINEDECKTCKPGFHLFNKKCVACFTIFQNCLECEDFLCKKCTDGYFELDGMCLPCSLVAHNCEECSNSSCFACSEGYFLSGHKCYPCSGLFGGCIRCDSHECFECETGYILENDSCKSCDSIIPQCETCIGHMCVACKDDFILVDSNTCKQCYEIFPFCTACNSSGQCSDCLDGYYLENGICNPCENNCLKCESKYKCLECEGPYHLIDDECEPCTDVYDRCIQCNQDGTCGGCETGYFLSNFQCEPCSHLSPQCVECNFDGSVCTKCASGFLTAGSKCKPCSDIIQKCLDCTDWFTCTDCDLPFYLENGRCVDCLDSTPNCVECEGKDLCTQCTEEFYTQNGQCKECSEAIPLCVKCSDKDTCTECEEGNYKAQGKCLPCQTATPYCIECDSSGLCVKCSDYHYLDTNNECKLCESPCLKCSDNDKNKCESCIDKHFLDNGECIPCPSNCSKCISSQYCTECELGYILSSTWQCLDCNIPYCSTCGPDFTCHICEAGYYRDSHGYCQPCSHKYSDCEECNNSHCTACKTGNFLSNGQCYPCDSLVLYCTECNSHQCYECKDGLYLSENTCVPCFYTTPNCVACEGSNCSACAYGYYLFDHKCKKCSHSIANCDKCSEDGLTCHICESGYTLYGNSCVSCLSHDPQCTSCGTHGECNSCNKGYYLDKGLCYPCSTAHDYCLDCDLGSCYECPTGYFLENGECNPCNHKFTNCVSCDANACKECTIFYYLNSYSTCSLCWLANEGCLECSTYGTECDRCDTGYYLDNYKCKSCSSITDKCTQCTPGVCEACEWGFYLTNNECKGQVDNCEVYGSTGECLTCKCGYYLDQFKNCASCSSKYPNCEKCNASSCLTCQEDYFLDNGVCLKCADNCSECNAVRCEVCNYGFYYDGQDCRPCSNLPNCKTCLGIDSCVECEYGYYPDGLCKPCNSNNPHCLDCTDEDTCIFCEDTYYLENGECKRCDLKYTNCELCDGNTCQKCKDGHSLSGGNCSNECSVPNCSVCSSSNICSQCENGFYLTGSNLCEPCSISNCASCSSASVCSECKQGFVLIDGVCEVGCNFPYCLACNSNNECTSCERGYTLTNGQCLVCKVYFELSDVEASFTEDYSKLMITFSQNSENRPYLCEDLVESADLLFLGEEPICRWEDPRHLLIILGEFYTLRNQVLRLRAANLWKTSGTCQTTFEPLDILCKYIYPFPVPELSIHAISTYSNPCSVFDLNIWTISANGLCKHPLQYSWSIDEASTMQDTVSSITGSNLMLPKLQLETGEWTFRATVTNVFGVSSTSQTMVRISNESFLSVGINAGNQFTMKSSSSYNFVCYVDSFCNDVIPEFQWSYEGLLEGSIPSTFAPGSIISTNSYQLAAKDMEGGATYIYKCSASQGVITGEAFLYLKVEKSDLIVKMDKDDGEISSESDLVLNASGSHDPDDLNTTLIFKWTCNCDLFTEESSETLVIPSSSLETGMVFTITLEGWADDRYASDQVTFEVAYPIPYSISNSYKQAKVNPQKEFVLNLQILSDSIDSINWDQHYGKSLEPSSETSYSFLKFNNTVMTPGHNYEYDCVLNLQSYAPYSRLSWTANTPPVCIDPINYSGLGDRIYLLYMENCLDKDEEDYPLTYEFGYRFKEYKIPLADRSLAPYLKIRLPTGSPSVFPTVCDSMNTCKEYPFTIPNIGSSTQVTDIFEQYEHDTKNGELIPGTVLSYAIEYDLAASDADLLFLSLDSYVKARSSITATALSSSLGALLALQDYMNLTDAEVASDVLRFIDELTINDPEKLSPQDVEIVLEISEAIRNLHQGNDLIFIAIEEILEKLLVNTMDSNPPTDEPQTYSYEGISTRKERITGDQILEKFIEINGTSVLFPSTMPISPTDVVDISLKVYQDYSNSSSALELSVIHVGEYKDSNLVLGTENLIDIQNLEDPIVIGLPCNVPELQGYECYNYIIDDNEWTHNECYFVYTDDGVCTINTFHTSLFSIFTFEVPSECGVNYLPVLTMVVASVICTIFAIIGYNNREKNPSVPEIYHKELPRQVHEVLETEGVQVIEKTHRELQEEAHRKTELYIEEPRVRRRQYHICLMCLDSAKIPGYLSSILLWLNILLDLALIGLYFLIFKDTDETHSHLDSIEYFYVGLFSIGIALVVVNINYCLMHSENLASLGIVLTLIEILACIIFVIVANHYNCADWNDLWFYIMLVVYCIDFIAIQTVVALIRKCSK